MPQLLSSSGMPRAEDKDLFCHLPSSATAVEGGRHKMASGLKVESIQDICSYSRPDSCQRDIHQRPPTF
jgi:hypothetical protein